MSRYRDFVLKHIDKIDPTDAEQRRDFFALVRVSVEKQIRSHYSDEAAQNAELAELEAAIAGIDAQYRAPPPLAPELPADAAMPRRKPAAKRASRKWLLLAGLAVVAGAAITYRLGLLSSCPAISCHDSGWVRARNTEANIITLPHRLGKLPRHISIWYSRTGTEDVAQPVTWSWSEATSGNPADIQVTPTETKLFIQPDKPLHGLMDSRQQWLTQETGFFRVIVRK